MEHIYLSTDYILFLEHYVLAQDKMTEVLTNQQTQATPVLDQQVYD